MNFDEIFTKFVVQSHTLNAVRLGPGRPARNAPGSGQAQAEKIYEAFFLVKLPGRINLIDNCMFCTRLAQ
jgi:hypothetical protein